jgi:hypothetical protein
MGGIMPRHLRIGFDFDCASSGMRELLAGVRDCRHSGRWDLRGLMASGLVSMLQSYRRSVAGIFGFIGTPPVARNYRRLGRPVVSLSAGMERPAFPSVWPDDEEVGRVAARHLLGRGLRRFAFVGERRWHFSAARRGGFERALREAGRRAVVLDDLEDDLAVVAPDCPSRGALPSGPLHGILASANGGMHGDGFARTGSDVEGAVGGHAR